MKVFNRTMIALILFLNPTLIIAQQSASSQQPLRKGLEDRYIFWVSIVSIVGFVIVLCTALLVFRNNEKALNVLFRHDFTILRVLTILFIIWAAGSLTSQGVFNEGISALFGAIVGYVFGSMRQDKSSHDA